MSHPAKKPIFRSLPFHIWTLFGEQIAIIFLCEIEINTYSYDFLFSVNFSEPLSMLQRISEDLEYADILSKAANCTDHCEQLAYVAAFTVSAFR